MDYFLLIELTCLRGFTDPIVSQPLWSPQTGYSPGCTSIWRPLKCVYSYATHLRDDSSMFVTVILRIIYTGSSEQALTGRCWLSQTGCRSGSRSPRLRTTFLQGPQNRWEKTGSRTALWNSEQNRETLTRIRMSREVYFLYLLKYSLIDSRMEWALKTWWLLIYSHRKWDQGKAPPPGYNGYQNIPPHRTAANFLGSPGRTQGLLPHSRELRSQTLGSRRRTVSGCRRVAALREKHISGTRRTP